MKKTIMLVVILVLSLIILFYVTENNNDTRVNIGKATSQQQSTHSSISDESSQKAIEPVKKESNDQEHVDSKLQQENLTSKWLEDRGYNFDTSSYAGYSIESLTAMAESGDLHAQSALAEKLLFSTNYSSSTKERLEYSNEAKRWYLETVIRGNSFNIGNLIQIHSLAVKDRKDVTPLELSKPVYGHTVEALAWSEIAKLRNDPLVGFSASKDFGELSDEERSKITKRTQEIYAFLVEERKRRGLGDFNNKMPEEVREYFKSGQ